MREFACYAEVALDLLAVQAIYGAPGRGAYVDLDEQTMVL